MKQRYIIVSECLSIFENDEDILKNAFVKKCVLCDNLNIGKNRQFVKNVKKEIKY